MHTCIKPALVLLMLLQSGRDSLQWAHLCVCVCKAYTSRNECATTINTYDMQGHNAREGNSKNIWLLAKNDIAKVYISKVINSKISTSLRIWNQAYHIFHTELCRLFILSDILLDKHCLRLKKLEWSKNPTEHNIHRLRKYFN